MTNAMKKYTVCIKLLFKEDFVVRFLNGGVSFYKSSFHKKFIKYYLLIK